MLWETDDAETTLTARFGFADAAAVADWLAQVVDEYWQLALQRLDRIVISSWNALAWVTASDHALIVKWSARPDLFAHLADIARLTKWLAARGVPTAAPFESVDDRLQVELAREDATTGPAANPRRFSLSVLPVMQGELLNSGNASQVQQAAHMLATIHDTLAAYPEQVGQGKPQRHHQLLHRDFRSANILHDGSRITAVLDWERVAYGSRTEDLALAAVLLSTRYHDWAPTTEDVRRTFIDAYCRDAPLTAVETQSLNSNIDAIFAELGWSRTSR
jgi:homoserine kinase type II